jgi:hypothetical protein
MKKGQEMSIEQKRKISKTVSKRHSQGIYNEEVRRKISLSQKGKKKPHSGRPWSKESRLKLSKSMKGKRVGPLNPWWRGGIWKDPYSINWTETLRRSIRERDKYSCRICGKMQSDKAFDIHHIDYNKLNCNPTNLITLCHSCHVKTNNNREKWIIFFNEKRDN